MTADIELNPMHVKVDKTSNCGSSPLGTRFSEIVDRNKYHVHLVQDCMLHECNTYCLRREDEKGQERRECRFGFGTESTPGSKVTPGRDLIPEPTIVKDKKGVFVIENKIEEESSSTAGRCYKYGEQMPTYSY